MPFLTTTAFVSMMLLPTGAEQTDDARLLVEAQLQAAAAVLAVMERRELPPAARAESLLPLVSELVRLHAARAQVDAGRLAEAEEEAANDVGVQQLALRLLRAIELCAASGYENSPELQAAVLRLSLAIEGELDDESAKQGGSALTGQNDAAPEH